VWISSSLETILAPTAIALGNFDGIHCGHRRVIEPVLLANDLVRPGGSGVLGEARPPQSRLFSTVVSFSPHPREYFSQQSIPLLSPLNERAMLLEDMGVDQLVLLPFDRELASLTPEAFVNEILIGRLQAQKINVGEDFRFGHRRTGTATDLKTLATQHGLAVNIIELLTLRGERISSTAIRQALQKGNLAAANRMLGRPYCLVGPVVMGQQLGRTIGFPTANLQLPPEKLLPSSGVYAVRITVPNFKGTNLKGTNLKGTNLQDIDLQLPLDGVMNLGYRPTVDGQTLTAEVHALEWSGDLYGQTLKVELLEYIRPEQKFASLDALKQQITADCAVARQLLVATAVS
jgi:riboflavin kinase / FMN adenylyltransferase